MRSLAPQIYQPKVKNGKGLFREIQSSMPSTLSTGRAGRRAKAKVEKAVQQHLRVSKAVKERCAVRIAGRQDTNPQPVELHAWSHHSVRALTAAARDIKPATVPNHELQPPTQWRPRPRRYTLSFSSTNLFAF